MTTGQDAMKALTHFAYTVTILLILLTFAQLSPTSDVLVLGCRASNQAAVGGGGTTKRAIDSVEERVSREDTGSMNVDEKHEPDLPKKLLLEAALQIRLPPSSPTPSPVATPDEERGNKETCVDDTSAVTDEEQEDTTIEQGKLVNHESRDGEPGDASDPDRARGELRKDRRSQEADTVSSWSSLSSPPASDDEQDRTSDDLCNEPKSLAATVEPATFDGVPSRSSRSAAAKARRCLTSQKGAMYRQVKKRTNKTAATKDEQVASIVAGLGSSTVVTLI